MTRRHRFPARRLAATVIAAIAVTATVSACTSTLQGTGTTTARPGSAGGSSGSTAPGSGASSPPAQPKANFSDCRNMFNLGAVSFPSGRLSRLSFGCARIQVPLDYGDPSGKSVTVQLVKVHDSANTNSLGSLLVNPGGPGGSGIELGIGLSAQLSDKVLSRFDIIGFDPRGVGLSTPVRCLSDGQKDSLNAASPDILTASGFAAAKKSATMVAGLCNHKYGSSLAAFNTVNTARDMDRIRKAVGDSKLNYLGFSYGTELGSVYAHLYPDKIRVMVLDGAVDPLTDPITSFADQLKGFELAFDQFAAYCVKTSPCRRAGNPRQAVYKIAARATASPIPSSSAGETRRATSSLVYTGVLSALYSRSQWPTLGEALTSALKGNSAGLLALADQYNQRYGGHYTNVADANNAINCNDSKLGPSDAEIRSTARSWETRFPIFGAWSAPSLFACQPWQTKRTPPPPPRAATPRKVLVIGNLHDPATPYQGAKDLTKTMGNAELLSWDGQGHTSYLQGSTCVDNYVNNYLVRGTLPPANTTCPT